MTDDGRTIDGFALPAFELWKWAFVIRHSPFVIKDFAILLMMEKGNRIAIQRLQKLFRPGGERLKSRI